MTELLLPIAGAAFFFLMLGLVIGVVRMGKVQDPGHKLKLVSFPESQRVMTPDGSDCDEDSEAA